MKKLFFIVVNIILLIITYFIVEYSVFLFELFRAKPLLVGDEISFFEFVKNRNHFFLEKIYVNFDKEYKTLPFRPVSGINYTDKKPIVLFGCSFVYGAGLNEKQIFSKKLSDYLKRKVYKTS